MSDERWVPIYRWEELYEVSDLGRVRRANNYKLIAITDGLGGYLKCVLYRRGGGRKFGNKSRLIHRLVLESFVGPSDLEVDHVDKNKHNNKLDNLRWVTRIENCKNRTNHVGEHNGNARLTSIQVAAIRLSKESSRAAAKQYGVCKTTILNARRGYTYSARGISIPQDALSTALNLGFGDEDVRREGLAEP